MYKGSTGSRAIRRHYQNPHMYYQQQQQPSNGGEQRVIRSEVWNCFDLDGLNAICRACNERLKVGPTRQTSSLWRHLKRHSREVQSRLLRPRSEQNFQPLDSDTNSRTTTGIFRVAQREAMGGMLAQQQEHEESPQNDGRGPMVTVDCKPIQNLELDQLLGIQSDAGQQSMAELEPMEGGEELLAEYNEDDVATFEQQPFEAIGNEANGESFESALVEFLLENALPFRRLLTQSPSLGRLLQLHSLGAGDSRVLPSVESLFTRLLPKMFERALEERKAQFEDDFFVLVLQRSRVEGVAPKGTWILRVSAVKLGDGFGLCSRSLGVFAYRGGLRHMRDALQKCFEHGPVQLKLWQVSAVVHDGSADFVELCRQLDLPGIPSACALLRNIYAELDNLEFEMDCVKRVKKRFETAIGDVLDSSHFSAFSIDVPSLVSRADAFFQNATAKKNADDADNNIGQTAEERLVDKFHTLWSFQRERLLSETVAKMSIFLNPSACHQQHGPFNADQWAQIEASIVEEICQACLPANGSANEMSENEQFERRADIEAEVNNFVDAAICEARRTTPSASSSCGDGGIQQQQHQSLSELLLWWRLNMDRFPRVGHLARQFCAVPVSESDGSDWKQGADKKLSMLLQNQSIDQRNAAYASELLRRDLDFAGGAEAEEQALQRLTQLLSVRMATLEKNGCAMAP